MGKFDKVSVYSISQYRYYEIDKDFREIIRILNNKNYGTSFCCQGHTDRLKSEKERQELFGRLNEWVQNLEPRAIQQIWEYTLVAISKRTGKRRWVYESSTTPLSEEDIEKIKVEKEKYYCDFEYKERIIAEW